MQRFVELNDSSRNSQNRPQRSGQAFANIFSRNFDTRSSTQQRIMACSFWPWRIKAVDLDIGLVVLQTLNRPVVHSKDTCPLTRT